MRVFSLTTSGCTGPNVGRMQQLAAHLTDAPSRPPSRVRSASQVAGSPGAVPLRTSRASSAAACRVAPWIHLLPPIDSTKPTFRRANRVSGPTEPPSVVPCSSPSSAVADGASACTYTVPWPSRARAWTASPDRRVSVALGVPASQQTDRCAHSVLHPLFRTGQYMSLEPFVGAGTACL